MNLETASSPQPLKICLISEKFPVFGSGQNRGFIGPIANGLIKAGHEVSVITWNTPLIKEEEIDQDGVKIHFLSKNKSYSTAFLQKKIGEKFFQLHKEKSFNILHSLTHLTRSIGLRKKKLGLSIAYDITATQMPRLFSMMALAKNNGPSQLKTAYKVVYHFLKSFYTRDRLILKNADAVFVYSRQEQLALERYYLYPEKKTFNIPYGVKIEDLSKRQASDKLKEKLNIPELGQVVLTISDMREKQDVINILTSFQKVAIKKPSSRLIIVGDGPAFKDIEYEMLNLALGNHVILTGVIPPHEISSYIDLSNIFINISGHIFGYNPYLLEAMTQEKIIIGSEIGALSTVIEQTVDGFLIRPADTTSLTQLLLELFSGHIDSKKIGENARAKALNLFNTKNMIREILKAYVKVLQVH